MFDRGGHLTWIRTRDDARTGTLHPSLLTCSVVCGNDVMHNRFCSLFNYGRTLRERPCYILPLFFKNRFLVFLWQP